MEERASKSIHNWRRYHFSKCYESDENLRFEIWRSAVALSLTPQKKTVIWVHNYSPSGVQMPQSYFWKICFRCDFWCAQTCSFRAIFALHASSLTLAVGAIVATCGKFFVYMHISALNHCGGFIKIFLLSIRSNANKLFCDFSIFAIFNRNFAKIVAPASKKMRRSSLSELASLLKNAENGMKIDRQTATQNLLNLNEQRSDFGAWQKKTRNKCIASSDGH